MVDLALLCNLYADGPTTLGRLRELGCENLADVERIERADLEWALQASTQNCERFRREARMLRERTATPHASPHRAAPPRRTEVAARAEEVFEATTDPRVGEASLSARLTPEHSRAVAPDAERIEPSAAEQVRAVDEDTSASARPVPSSSILGVLLQAWRRASGRSSDAPARPRHESNERRVPAPRESFASEVRTEPPSRDERPGFAIEQQPEVGTAPSGASAGTRSTPFSAQSAPSGAAHAEVPTVELTPAEPKTVVRSAPASSTERRPEHGTPLERIGFQGVEADYAEQLVRLGVRTVEDFLAAQPLELAGRSSMRYTVLLRMQFLARRELERVVRG